MSLFGDLPAPVRAKPKAEETRDRDLEAQLARLRNGAPAEDTSEEEDDEEEVEEEEEASEGVDEEEQHRAQTQQGGGDLRRRPRPRDDDKEQEEAEVEGQPMRGSPEPHAPPSRRHAPPPPFPHASAAATGEGPPPSSSSAGTTAPPAAKRVRIHEDVVTATYVERPAAAAATRGEAEDDQVAAALRRIASHIGNPAKFPKVGRCGTSTPLVITHWALAAPSVIHMGRRIFHSHSGPPFPHATVHTPFLSPTHTLHPPQACPLLRKLLDGQGALTRAHMSLLFEAIRAAFVEPDTCVL